jgi:hypothetical protein
MGFSDIDTLSVMLEVWMWGMERQVWKWDGAADDC